MRITIVGAGNIGLSLTAYISINKEVEVILFTNKKNLSEGLLQLHDVEKNTKQNTRNFLCTDNPEIAFTNADIIFVTYPAFLRKKFIENYENYINSDTFLGFVPGYGGTEYVCKTLIERGVSIFGFQRVPYVARSEILQEITIAKILSKKEKLFIGSIPSLKINYISKMVETLLDIPVQPLPEYLSITLAPSNPLLHITGLYNVFKDKSQNYIFDSQLKFYEAWNDSASNMLFNYDAEVQNICNSLKGFDMSDVISLPVYYESPTPEQMTNKLKSIEAFKVVQVPLKKVEQGYQMDLSSRMFIEDFPFGICILKDFAVITKVSTPTIDLLLEFYTSISGHKYYKNDNSYTSEIKDTGVPGIYGIRTIEDLIRFYHR